jgi:hypothetical protein
LWDSRGQTGFDGVHGFIRLFPPIYADFAIFAPELSPRGDGGKRDEEKKKGWQDETSGESSPKYPPVFGSGFETFDHHDDSFGVAMVS